MKCLDVVLVCICITTVNSTTPTLSQYRLYPPHSYLTDEMWITYQSVLTARLVGAWTLISVASRQNRGLLSTDCLRNWTGKKWWPRECIFTFHPNIKICTYIEKTLVMFHYLRLQNNAGWKNQDRFQKEVRTRIKEIWHDWFFERLSENI